VSFSIDSFKGILRRKGRPVVSFDPQGLIFAVAMDVNNVKLFDLRSFEKGPFSSFLVAHNPVEWTGMKFSGDGKYILLSTTTNLIFLLDAFTGDMKRTFTSFSNAHNTGYFILVIITNLSLVLEASFTPDAQFVISGSDDGTIHVWETLTGKEVVVLKGHTGPTSVVQWNPKTMMMASGCTNLAFWIPADINE
jgi:COMPASS component SWD2